MSGSVTVASSAPAVAAGAYFLIRTCLYRETSRGGRRVHVTRNDVTTGGEWRLRGTFGCQVNDRVGTSAQWSARGYGGIAYDD